MRRPGEVLSRLELLERLGLGVRARSNVVDVYVRYLREKIDRPFGCARSRRCAASVTACASRVMLKRIPIRWRLTSPSRWRWPLSWSRSAPSSTSASTTP